MTWSSGGMLDGSGSQHISTSAYPEPVVIRDSDLMCEPDDECDDECTCGDDLG